MRGGIPNPLPNKAHIGQYSALHDSHAIMDSAKLCGTCHDIVVPAHFSGAAMDQPLEQTYAEWQGSIFATGKAPLSCGGCHFNSDFNVTVADYPGVTSNRTQHHHDFPGVDVALVDDVARGGIVDLHVLSASNRAGNICSHLCSSFNWPVIDNALKSAGGSDGA